MPVVLPFMIFTIIFVGTYLRWILPFQDSGRDTMTAARLADGERLYVDVSSWYGPLPPIIDAFSFRLFGKHLDVLIALRTLLALAGTEALRRLLRRATGNDLAAGTITAFVVAVCFFTRLGGTYPFPYSVASLEGAVATWIALELALGSTGWPRSLAAAAVAGLAAGCKLEYVPAALGGLAVALFLARPVKEFVAGMFLAASLGAAAYLAPIALLGREQILAHGFLVASRLPDAWKHLYSMIFWANGTASTFPLRLWTDVVFPSGLYLGFFLWLAHRMGDGKWRRALLFVAGAASFMGQENTLIQGLVPAAACFLAWDIYRAGKNGGRAGLAPGDVASFTIGAAMLPLMGRQPFSAALIPYTAFTAPLAFAFALAWLVRRLGASAGLLLFIGGVTCAQAASRTWELHRVPMRLVSFERGRFYLHDPEAILLEEILAAIKEKTPQGSYVAAFPESGMVLFASDRKNPFVDEAFLPGIQGTVAETEMIRRLDAFPPAAAIIVNRSLHEYGLRVFGVGYLERFHAELMRRMTVAARLGKPDRDGEVLLFPARADEGVLLLPASDPIPLQ